MQTLAFKRNWTEPLPTPLEMSDTEIVEWLDEYADGVFQVAAATETLRVVIIECEGISTTRRPTLREAVCLAAAKLKEVNE